MKLNFKKQPTIRQMNTDITQAGRIVSKELTPHIGKKIKSITIQQEGEQK